MAGDDPVSMQLVSLRLPVPGLPRPLRLVHLTDLHVGRRTHRHEAAVRLANASGAELAVLTGDYVGYGLASVRRLAELLAGLRMPAVATLGNHDHWAGAEVVAAAMEGAGVAVLRNRSLRVGPLTLVGVDDPLTGNDDVAAAVAGVEGPRLGLVHHPRAAPALWAAGVPTVLAGHTHGGHVDLGRLTDSFHRFVAGVYDTSAGLVYVNPGIGGAVVAGRLGRRSRATVAIIEVADDSVMQQR